MATDNGAVETPQARYGEVFDRGYAHYNGPRLGRVQAFKSLVGFSIKRAMGIRKGWTSKVLPIILYIAVIVPLIVMIGIDAIVPDFNFASYTGYITWTFTVVGIFVAMSAPEMLCVDRRERTLPLYFSRAIGRFDYVFAKITAMTLLTMTMSLVPAVVLWFGRQLTSDRVWQAMKDNIGDLGRIILIGSLIALVLGIIGLVISSMTDRKAVAIAVILVGFLVVTLIGNVALELLEDYEWSKYFIFLSLTDSFRGMSHHLFDDVQYQRYEAIFLADLPLRDYLLYFAGIVVVGLLILRWRYRPTDY
jgi:ABC-2 type transport system permease protein